MNEELAVLKEIRDILLRIEKQIEKYDEESFANWLWNSPLPEDRVIKIVPSAKGGELEIRSETE